MHPAGPTQGFKRRLSLALALNKSLYVFKTLALLDRFKSKLSSAISENPEMPGVEEEEEELGEDDDKGW